MREFPQKVILITGMSGAGKTTALRCFEDLGYFCVDNVPPQLIETFLHLLSEMKGRPEGVVFVCDVRSGALFDSLEYVWETLREKAQSASLIFLDASDSKLIQRFSELRRQHPLSMARISNEEAIKEERKRLEALKEIATKVIDTTELTSSKLIETLRSLFISPDAHFTPTVTIMSFGYKYGVPADADFVFDTRFLPNPYYVDELKGLTGISGEVRNFVLSGDSAEWFGDRIVEIVERTLPGFEGIQKLNVQISIGCTGGKHRSVALAEWLKEALERQGRRVRVIHRDIDRP